MKALVIPVNGPIEEIELAAENDDLDTLQRAVGGYIQALPLPGFVDPTGHSTAYVNEEGKYTCKDDRGAVAVNFRATDFMVPGVGIFFGDYIAGPMVLCGFDPSTGEHDELPEAVVKRARLIESEAG
jgi:hypothetical protein